MKYYSVSWTQLHTITHALTEQIKEGNPKLDLIVGIARGGLTIAHIASDFLNLPVASFTISSYKDFKQQGLSNVSFHVGGDLKGKRVLLVDDVSDTGRTFIRGIQYLTGLGAADIITASPYVKPWSHYMPDFSVKQIDEWIVFPYDMRETVEAIQANLQKDGETAENILKHLTDMKIPKKYITKYFKPL